jgi:hypothetical protein
MEDRRTFLALAAALLPIGFDAQTAPPPPGGDLVRQALTGPFEGFEAVLTQVTLPAGQPGAATRAIVTPGSSSDTCSRGSCALRSTTNRNG